MQISILTLTDGSVEGHRAGCQDVARKVKSGAEKWTAEFSSKREAFLDFIAEADGDESSSYDIDWLPCATELPAS